MYYLSYSFFVILLLFSSTLHTIPFTKGSKPLFIYQVQHQGNLESFSLIPYDASLYNLAYSVYLQTNSVKKAYYVSLAAVEQRPNESIWHERLAQTALWTNNASRAVKQYLILAQEFKNQEALIKGTELSKKMHIDSIYSKFLLMELGKGNNSKTLWKNYLSTLLHLGEMDELKKELVLNKNKISKKLSLEYFSKIYALEDDPEKELLILKQLVKVGSFNPDFNGRLALIYLNQKKLLKAEDSLKAIKNKVPASNIKFWYQYAQIEYLMKNERQELYAFQQLLKYIKDDIYIYTRLVELTKDDLPALAYRYAQLGRIQFPNNYVLITDILYLASRQNRFIDVMQLISSIPKSMNNLLHYDSNYWNAIADYWKRKDNNLLVINSYLEEIKNLPRDDDAKSNLLYYLIDKDDEQTILKALFNWSKDLQYHPLLWTAYAQGLALIHRPVELQTVLSYFLVLLPTSQYNPYWLIMFRDTLESSGFTRQAAAVNRFTWPLYLNMLRKQKAPPNYFQVLDYVKLSLSQAVGEPSKMALYILQQYFNKDVALLLITWALRQNNYPLGWAIYWRSLAEGVELPAWSELSLFLHRHDKTAVYHLIKSKRHIASYRDHIRAAMEINAIPLGQTVAYNSLKKHRHDRDLYDFYYTPIMLGTANNLFFSQEYYQYGNVEGPRTNISASYFLFPSLKLMPYNSIWLTNNIQSTSPVAINNVASNQPLASVPPRDERAGLFIQQAQGRGPISLDLGYRNDLSSFMTAKLIKDYQALSDLHTRFLMGYNQPADDTAGLLVGGMKNNLAGEFGYKIFIKDHLFANYIQNSFYTQEHYFLANGWQANLKYEHKFRLEYPDWTIAPYTVATQYFDKRKGLLRGNILSIVPSNVIPDVNFLIPENFIEYGITCSFGQSFIEDYTHRWRPFASFTLSNSSTVGIGKLFNLGIAGTVFGRDHLLIYYDWGSNQGQGIQISQLAKISYRIYI